MKRRLDFDLARVLCMCGVVYLHVASTTFYDLSHLYRWEFSCWVNVFAVLGVPLFFMMSGALLLSPGGKNDPGSVLRRRVPKVLLPLLVWSLAVLLYMGFAKDLGGWSYVWDSARRLLGTPANVGYWFLYALIPIYLLLPVLGPMMDGLDQRRRRYALLLWLALTLGLATLRSFLPEAWQESFSEHPTFHVGAVGGYLGYFLLGAHLDRLEKLPGKKLLVWGTAAASVLAGVLCHVDSYAQQTWSGRFTDYLTVFTALRAAGAFLLLKALFGEKETKSPAVRALSAGSFCVYLSHPLVTMEAREIWYRATGQYDPESVGQVLLLYLCVLAVCVAGAFLLGKIPGVRYLFTGQKKPRKA